MEIGFIGLGRMGANMGTRALKAGHTVSGYDPVEEARARLEESGGKSAPDLHHLVALLEKKPRALWMMIPSGPAVDGTISTLLPLLEPGDIIIDGGNSNFRDSQRRYESLKKEELHFLDCGTSGGIWGLKEGYCMMLGGDVEPFRHIEPLLKALAPNKYGYRLVGPSGAGHFAKMIHNGIEYGLMQGYAEGFEILEKSEFPFDLAGLCRLWNQGSVIRSWMLELAENAFHNSDSLEHIVGYVEDSGEGRWTVQAAIDENVPAPVITLSLQMRFRSRQQDSFSSKLVAALRHEFGGHAVQLSEVPESTATEPTPSETGERRTEGEVDKRTLAFAPEETLVAGGTEGEYDSVAAPSPSVVPQPSPTVRSSEDGMMPAASPRKEDGNKPADKGASKSSAKGSARGGGKKKT